MYSWSPSIFAEAPVLATTFAVFLLAGLVKGVVGLGLPTVSMALLALSMSPAHAAALLVVPSLVTNIWQMRPWASLPSMLRRLAPLSIGVLAGTSLGTTTFGAPGGPSSALALGVALIVYAGWGLSSVSWSVRPGTERWLGPIVGLLTGSITATTGVFVVPAVPYLQALGLQRDHLIQAMGISFTVSTVALGVGLATEAQYTGSLLATSTVMLVPALVGMLLGDRLRRRLSQRLFRRVLFWSLALLGVHMVVHVLTRG